AIQDAGTAAGELGNTLTGAVSDLQSEVGAPLDATVALKDQVGGAIDAAIQSTGQTAQAMQETADLTLQTVGELGDKVTELAGRVEQLGADTGNKAMDLGSRIADDVTSRAESLFGDVTSALGSDFMSQAEAGFN